MGAQKPLKRPGARRGGGGQGDGRVWGEGIVLDEVDKYPNYVRYANTR